ncbi:MAG: hypothetical protein DMG35_06255 [Acidobacteria bacterium]|nr:MAG: hypothetical protein AUH86_16330 [Acidobacteria bacterium 13_1_40CM_4_58_4]PYT62848.1 MAG: hypothetical protein DMG35_06255 [Acidobacteriota bacterium]
MHKRVIMLVSCALCFGGTALADGPAQNWTHYVRIGAYGLNSSNADAIVGDAERSHVFGIEVDNDIPGRYESFLNPAEKLAAIRALAENAHRAGNKSFVYIAGTECITAHASKSAHSVAKDHPDWLQRKITGEPAVFTAGAAFWISPGDEDVWITPYAPDWRKTYMERVRQIAATGIDGIYVDIPYWMTHFDGWENTWASFDDYTVAAFQQRTGLDARRDLILGDFSSTNFRKWIDFRIATLTDFLREIRDNARAINPTIMVIPEIYPGIEEEATRVGADVYEMYAAVDAIAHEYEFGEGDHMASSRSQLDWFLYQAGMLSFRAFAQGKATWILNYSWDGDKNVDPREAMKNLAMSQVMVGANFWDAPGHVMAGSNDLPTRALIFDWIEKHERNLYSPRLPMHPVGVYFSPKSRDYDQDSFLPSYRGVLVLLLQKHLEFQVVTPRTLSAYYGEVLVLPSVSFLEEEEKKGLRSFVKQGGRLVITGKNATGIASSEKVKWFEDCPGRTHLQALQKDFARGSGESVEKFLDAVNVESGLKVDASPTIAANMALVEGKPHIFLANFAGLVPHKIAVPEAERGARITVSNTRKCSLKFLPFLGEVQVVHGQEVAQHQEFVLPRVERGAVVWLDECH